jgi:nucleotide-binding universal stress UspA family protein
MMRFELSLEKPDPKRAVVSAGTIAGAYIAGGFIPLTSLHPRGDRAEAGARLQALAASPEFARLQVEYEVRRGKQFVELIIAGRAWLADLIVVGAEKGLLLRKTSCE